MENITLQELVSSTKGDLLLGDPHANIHDISIDTRTLHRGDYYFALIGKKYNGHEFLSTAIEKLAGGLIISSDILNIGNPFPFLPAIVRVKDTLKALGDLAKYYRKKWDIPVVAITGSNGKTTTKEMLASILNLKGATLKSKGNFNNQIGLPLSILDIGSIHQFAIIEMGTSIPGEIKILSEITNPAIGVITNIGPAHLENFIDKEGVFNEKKTLLENIQKDGCIILNNDDQYLASLKNDCKNEIITFGIENDSEVRASNLKFETDSTSFKLSIKDKSIIIDLPVQGKFNVYNALAASAVAFKLNIEIDTIKQGLENFTKPEMRMQVKNLPEDITIINDAYNANPVSMKESIQSMVQTYPKKEKIIVIGDMLELGSSGDSEHFILGEFIETQPISKIFLYGQLMERTFQALKNKSSAKHFLDKNELANELKSSIKKNSVVLFKGSRSMCMEELIEELFPEKKLSANTIF